MRVDIEVLGAFGRQPWLRTARNRHTDIHDRVATGRQGVKVIEQPFVLHRVILGAGRGSDQYDFSNGLLGLDERI
jgi:hypothetical protein